MIQMTDEWTRPALNSIKEAYHHLFNSGLDLSKIKDAALENRLFPASDHELLGVPGRSLAWKLFLTPGEPLQAPFDSELTADMAALRASRKKYSESLLEKLRAPDGSYEKGFVVPGSNAAPERSVKMSANLDTNNPLSLHNENPWTEWFAAVELRKTILQDVERTFPDVGYFRDPDVQQHLSNVLFLYSVTNPSIGYRQGMHELLAPLYLAIDFDSMDPETDPSTDNPTMLEFCSRLWVEADAWALFIAVMHTVSRWYEWRESPKTNLSPLSTHVHLNVSNGPIDFKPYNAPIVQDCHLFQAVMLKSVDPLLFKSLESAGIEPQIYGIRWLRLLFTREFSMHDAMLLWDGLFACDPTFGLARWVCVAMLIRIRNYLIPADYSGQLTYLLRYPAPPSLDSGLKGSYNHITLLLKQALALQMSPIPSTGLSVILENYNILNIAIEVPVPALPSPRHMRDKSMAVPRSSGVTDGPSHHSRQHSSAQVGLPELIARGLLDRGENLGINKTLMNAVTEIKRNMPELGSLVRLPLTSPTSFSTFPLTDERMTEDRPPWEPRSRLETEREIADFRSRQKKLGHALEWIVDTLLQDESGVENSKELASIKMRKREALESLSHVRDVLLGSVDKVDDQMLVGEEEMKARNRRSRDNFTQRTEVPRMEVSKPATVPVHESRPKRMNTDAFPYSNQTFPSSRTAQSRTSSPARRSPSPHLSSKTFTPPSHIQPTHRGIIGTDSARLAPWNYTRSDFSGGATLPVSNLPRLPPPTSLNLHPPPAPSVPPAVAAAATAAPSVRDISSSGQANEDEGSRRDPLGVLQ